MHFLNKEEVKWERPTRKNWAAVKVKVDGRGEDCRLTIEPGISVLRLGVQLVKLPERCTVISSEGEVIKPTPGAQFFVTIETFDPFHLITEIPEGCDFL